MFVREATELDVRSIARVHVDTWRTTYKGIVSDKFLNDLSYNKREEMWNKFIHDSAKNKNYIFVAEDVKDGIIGFATCGIERESDNRSVGELYAIYILKSYQNKGIGKLLFNTVKEKLEELKFSSILIWVLESNNQACRFYEEMGGKKLKEQDIIIGGDTLREIAYKWILK